MFLYLSIENSSKRFTSSLRTKPRTERFQAVRVIWGKKLWRRQIAIPQECHRTKDLISSTMSSARDLCAWIDCFAILCKTTTSALELFQFWAVCSSFEPRAEWLERRIWNPYVAGSNFVLTASCNFSAALVNSQQMCRLRAVSLLLENP